MIRLPDIPTVANTPIDAPAMSAQTAAAPGMALGHVAEAIGSVGDSFFRIAQDAQRKENARMVSEKLTGLAQAEADLQLSLRNEQDPAAIIQKTREFYASQKGAFDADDLPEEVRDELRGRFDTRATQGTIAAGAAAARLQDNRTRMALENELSAHITAGDQGGADDVLARIGSSGLATPEEVEKLRMSTQSRMTLSAAKVAISRDARGWLDANPRDQVPPGVEPLQWEALHSTAQEALRGQTIEDIGTIQDGIEAGQIDTEEELQKAAGHMRPTVQAKLREQMIARATDAAKARMRTPDAQAEVIGRVSSMLDAYDPASEGFDEAFVEMDGLLRTLPPSAARDEMERQMRAVREGKQKEIRDIKDASFDALATFHKQGGFGKLPDLEKVPVKRFVDDGFLRDPEKLQRLGFDAKQSGKIAELQDPAEAQKKFIETWKDRKEGSVKASPEELSIANAIRLGHGLSEFEDPASAARREAAELRRAEAYGAATMKLADWLKRNPKASEDQVKTFVRDLSDENTVKDLSKGIIKRGTTTQVDVKLSNYGYASDTTPDSNSAAGIGHRNNKLIPEKSAAISKSLADRLKLKHGDEVEVTTDKGVFRVFYHDTVPADDTRTGPLPETIDLYRPASGSNTWGGRVKSITKLS